MSKKIPSKQFENVHPILPKSKVLSPIGNVVNKRKLSRDEILVNSMIVPSNPAKRRRLMDKIIPKSQAKLQESFKDVNVVYDYQDTNTLLPLVEYLHKTEQTVYTTDGCNGNIIRIKYKDGVEISINHHYKVAKKNAEALKIPFRNQNLIQLANEYLKIYTDGDEWKSVFNKQARDMMLKYKVGIFNHTFYEPEEGAELKGADINNCWSDGNDYPWLVYNSLDEVRPYLKRQDAPLIDGKYYVETDNYFPLKGNNWYHRVSLEGIPFTIKYEFIPSKVLTKDYFNEYVKRIYTLCEESKLSVNGAIGCLNKKTSKNQKDYFTSSVNDAIRFYL